MVGDKRSLSKASGSSAGASSQAIAKRAKGGASSEGASGIKGKHKAKSKIDQDEDDGSENSECVSDLSGDRYGMALAPCPSLSPSSLSLN